MEGGSSIQERDEVVDSTEEPRNGLSYLCCHPKGTFHRFIALGFMCFLGFGSYFCYDTPSSLQDHIEEDLNQSTTSYALLYSMYSWPNVIFCFIGGFLIDRVFGIRLGTNIYMALTFLGQLIFATGVILNTFWLAVLGRFVFGIGAESLAVAQNNYAVLWFKGKELNMVFGLQLSFARLGSTVNFLVMESIYTWVTQEYKGYEGLGISLFVAATTCVLSAVCGVVLSILDKRAERIVPRHSTTNAEVVKLTDVKDFKPTFWLISIICVSYYVAIFPFIGLGKGFFTTMFHLSNQEANTVNSLVYLISAGASPVLGLLIDKAGRNVTFIAVAVVVTIISHCLLAFTSLTPYVGMILMGIAYSCLASSLWPLVSLIIPEYQLGTAYGVCQAVQNLGLAVFTIVAGTIEDDYGYLWSEVFFIGSLIIALIGTIVLWLLDLWQHGMLNLSPKARLTHQHLLRNLDDQEKLDSEAGISTENSLQPSSDAEIRNRYLSKIGAPVSETVEE